MEDFPAEQYNEYQWFSIDELLNNAYVHEHTKGYFRKL